jgi:type VI secretion system secreted protein VgrG
VDATVVGARHAVTVVKGPDSVEGIEPTGIEMVDRRITLTTGEATITLEGPNITLDAAASILLSAAADITITGRANIKVAAGAAVRVEAEDGDLVIQGGPMVRLNPEVGGRRAREEAEERGDALPVKAPPGVDLDEGVEAAEDHTWFNPAEPRWFETMTAEGGPWDFKQRGSQYEDFGNFHFGVVGKAMGIPEGVLLRRAGKAAAAKRGADPRFGDPGNGLFGGTAPYGNDPRSEAMIRKGFAHYEKRYR